MKKNPVLDALKKILVVSIASLIMAINFNTFVDTGGLYPGGASGVVFLVQRLALRYWDTSIPYTPIYLMLNIIPIYISLRFIGKKFTIYTCLVILEVSILTDLLPSYVVTYDILLISIFGGLIGGLSVAMCLLVDTSGGGIDIISVYLAQKRGVDSWNILLAFNVILLVIAGFFFGWDKALYSIIYQFAATQVIHILDRSYQKETLLVVTHKGREICGVIYEITNHGATLISGKGAHEQSHVDVVYSVVSAPQTKKVLRAIKETDPDAFVNTIETEGITGRFYQKPKE